MSGWGEYAKTVNGTLIVTAGVLVTALQDGAGIDTVEWAMIATAFLGSAVGIFAASRTPASLRRYGPVIVTAVVAGITQFVTAFQDGGGINGAEWATILVAFLVALGAVFNSPNAPESRLLARHARPDNA